MLSTRPIPRFIRQALREDAAQRDITSRAVLPDNPRIRARILAKAPGILAGVSVAAQTFHLVDPSIRCRVARQDSVALSPGMTILSLEGRAQSIFAAERTALNFLGHLCGIATLTAAYVRRVQGMRAKIFDTRKTLPGLRALEKYAVRAGGGRNHRSDLAEAILIKTNHLRAMRQPDRRSWPVARGSMIRQAIQAARRRHPASFIEVEVAFRHEFRAALGGYPDAILLDNWKLPAVRKAVALLNALRATSREPRATARGVPLLEVSGGVTLANVRAIAKTGVDRISIGRLTHSAPALDVSLEVLA